MKMKNVHWPCKKMDFNQIYVCLDYFVQSSMHKASYIPVGHREGPHPRNGMTDEDSLS